MASCYLEVDWIIGDSIVGEQQGSSSIHKVVVDLISGYLAGVVAVLVTGPLWMGKSSLVLIVRGHPLFLVAITLTWLILLYNQNVFCSEYTAKVTGGDYWTSSW